VVFIAGTSWSGSTILEQALAQIEGWSSVGELYWLWDPQWPQMVCECGEEFGACPFWSAVLEEAYGSHREAIRSRVHDRGAGLLRHSILPTLTTAADLSNPGGALAELGSMIEPVYRSVAKVTGEDTVVDASKSGLWGLAVSLADSLDVRAVHLVRDPLGFVASDGNAREVPFPLGATRPPRPPARSLITWLLNHLEAEVLARHAAQDVVVLYEELVRAPNATIRRVVSGLTPLAGVDRVIVDDAIRVRRAGHAIGGNPRRPGPGRTSISRRGLQGAPPMAPLVRRTLMPLANSRYRHYARAAHAP
jgi:hypothetical protein